MQVVMLSGPANVGTSAVADALCDRYDRMLHIDVSVIRDFLRMGRLRPEDESAEAKRQRALFIASATDMACRFLEAGYGVVIDDQIVPDDLAVYLAGLASRPEPKHFVLLLPRTSNSLPLTSAHDRRVYQQLANWPNVAVIDTAGLTAEAAADRVMTVAAEGLALVGGGAAPHDPES